MPDPASNLNGQTMAQLASEHHDLSAMMTFVRDEIRQDMPHVERKIAPAVGRRYGNRAAVREPELQQAKNAATALAECSNQFSRSNFVSINDAWHCDAMLLP